MIGILLITHGSFGEALVQNACHVLNKRPVQVNQLGVSAQDDPLDLLPLARQMLHLVDDGDGVLLLSDLFGATPCNVAQRLVEGMPAQRLVCGVNLPMLLRALCYRHEDVDSLVSRAVDGGKAGVMQVAACVAPQPIPCKSHD